MGNEQRMIFTSDRSRLHATGSLPALLVPWHSTRLHKDPRLWAPANSNSHVRAQNEALFDYSMSPSSQTKLCKLVQARQICLERRPTVCGHLVGVGEEGSSRTAKPSPSSALEGKVRPPLLADPFPLFHSRNEHAGMRLLRSF